MTIGLDPTRSFEQKTLDQEPNKQDQQRLAVAEIVGPIAMNAEAMREIYLKLYSQGADPHNPQLRVELQALHVLQNVLLSAMTPVPSQVPETPTQHSAARSLSIAA